jgi:hypothetical protein
MSKTFRPWKIDEPLFLPPTVQDFVAKDHLAHLVLSLVRDDLDLAEITGTYGSERGQPPFDPTMMTVLLLYSYCCGIYSSRRSAKGCREQFTDGAGFFGKQTHGSKDIPRRKQDQHNLSSVPGNDRMGRTFVQGCAARTSGSGSFSKGW